MERVRVALEWFLNPDHVPLLLGQARGWFAEVGLEVELVEPAEHLDPVAMLASGDLDVAITEPLHLVVDVAEGAEIAGFARFLHTNGGVMFLASSGIARPRDLVGKRIQYPGAPGPGGRAIVDTMIQADGGPPSAHTLVPVNRGFHHTDALLDGDADAATLAFYNVEVVEARMRGADARFFALKDWGVPDFCQLILVASRDTLARRRDVLRRFVRVLMRGADVLHQDPDTARAAYAEATGTDPHDPLGRAIFDATVPCFTFDLTMAPSYYAALGDWLVRTGQIGEAPGFDAVWDEGVVG